MARYLQRSRRRRAPVRRGRRKPASETYFQKAKRYGKNVLVAGTGAALGGMSAAYLYRNYPNITAFFKRLGFTGLDLANKVYDYVAAKGLGVSNRANDAVSDAYLRAKARWEAYQSAGTRNAWNEIHDSRPPWIPRARNPGFGAYTTASGATSDFYGNYPYDYDLINSPRATGKRLRLSPTYSEPMWSPEGALVPYGLP